jgi:hypothetical protein
MTFVTRRGAKVAVCLLLLASTGFAQAEQRDIPIKQQFVIRLKEAIRANDKGWLADHTRYPLRYYGHATRLIRSKASFVKQYPKLIGDKLRAGILAQDPENVFENYQGMMLGNGGTNIWVQQPGDGTGSVFEIVTINDKE